MNNDDQLRRCPICRRVLTLAVGAENCCAQPDHWQAAGRLKAHDYYALAQLAARAGLDAVSGTVAEKAGRL